MSVISAAVQARIEANAITARINALGVSSARILPMTISQNIPLKGATQTRNSCIECWLGGKGVTLVIEPILSDGHDSYHVQSYSKDNALLCSNEVHKSPLHTAIYLEALKQIDQGV